MLGHLPTIRARFDRGDPNLLQDVPKLALRLLQALLINVKLVQLHVTGTVLGFLTRIFVTLLVSADLKNNQAA
jgi:hypothetical protein